MLDNDFILLLGRVAKPVDAKIPDADIFLLSRNPDYKGDLQEVKTENFELNLGSLTKKINLKIEPTIKAKWLPFGNPNRISSPQLYGGETVLVLYNVKTKFYYYTTIFTDLDLRRTELVEYFWSARKKTEEEGSDERLGSYRLMIDTENKQVLFTTSKENDEYTVFRILLDLLKGQYLIQNDFGDFINLIAKDKDDPDNSPAKLHTNIDGEIILKHTKSYFQESLENIVTRVEGDRFNLIKGSTFVKVESDSNTSIKGNLNLEVKNNYNLSSSKVGIKSKDELIIQSDSKIGVTSLQGDVTVFGGSSITLFSPTINLVGPAVSVTGALQAAAISVGGGSSSSPKPLVIKSNTISWDKFNKELDLLTEKVKIPTEDGDDGSTQKEDDSGDKPDPDKQPSEVDTKTSSKDAIISVEGKIELKGGSTVKIESNTSTIINSGYFNTKGSNGVNIEGGGKTLYDILDGIIKAIKNIDTSLSAIAGASVPTQGGPASPPITYKPNEDGISKLLADNATFKGSQTFSTPNISNDQLSELSKKIKRVSKE